jgi:hypothetical protein
VSILDLPRRRRERWADVSLGESITCNFRQACVGARVALPWMPRSPVPGSSRPRRRFIGPGRTDGRISGGLDVLGGLPAPPEPAPMATHTYSSCH